VATGDGCQGGGCAPIPRPGVPSFISLVAKREVFADRIPDHLLAIGYHGSGGQICIELTGEEPGSIWFYDPEFELDGDEDPHPDLLTRMCDNFVELLEILEPIPELEEALRRTTAREDGGSS